MSSQDVIRRDGNNLLVLNEDGYCCVCKEADWDKLQWFQMGDSDPENPLKFTVCKSCTDEPDRFRDYLAAQFEESLASDPAHWRKNPDETWSELCAHCGGEITPRTRECKDCHRIRERT